MSIVDRFVELKARRDRGGAPPVSVQAAPVAVPVALDVPRLVAEELSRRERARAEAERAAHLASFEGGPCFGCGSVFSWVRKDLDDAPSEDVPGWQPAGPGRTVCYVCSLDRTFGGQTLSDVDWRGGVALELLRAASRAGHWVAPAVGARLAAAGTRVFWAEHDPRPPTHVSEGPVAERFAFVDLDAVVAALAPPQPPYQVGIRCPQCGRNDRWRHDPGGSEDRPNPDGGWMVVTTPPLTWCAWCRYEVPVAATARRHPEQAVTPSWLGRLDPLDPGPAP